MTRTTLNIDDPILEELKARGFTDYSMRPLLFSSETPNAISIATDRPGGFGEADLAVLDATLPAFAAVAELQQTLQLEFQQKLVPAIDRVAATRGLQFIFSAGDGGLIWANPALDVTLDVVEELNKAAQETP